MRKFSVLFAALMAAGLLSVGVAQAEPSGKCGGAPAATGTDGANSASVCVAGVGSLTAAQKGDTGGYIVADGDSTNPEVTGGYIGVDDKSIVVCSDSGDYSYASSTQCNPAP